MQTINEEEDMTTVTEFSKTVIAYAEKRADPFTSYEVFTEIEEADDNNLVSQTLSHLYRKGILARKKIDNLRFSYAPKDKAPAGYESVLPVSTKEQPTQSVANAETKPLIEETPARKTETKDTEKPAPKTADVKVDEFMASEIGQIEIPGNFILSLKTPGGLEITIKTGVL